MKKIALLTASLLLATPAMAGDWTPVLKGMQENCMVELPIGEASYMDIADFPDNIRKDIVSAGGLLQLENAKLFGYQLISIRPLIGGADAGGHEYRFKKLDFNKLLPQFHFKGSNNQLQAGSKKAFLVQESQNPTTNEYTYTFVAEIPYPQLKNYTQSAIYNHFVNSFQKNQNYKKYALLMGTPTGWAYYSNGYHSYLEINKAKNTIKCSV